MAMVRAVKTMTMRATKKMRATRARATRAMTETSPREERDGGHNNQLGTKLITMARTLAVTTARGMMMAARAMATGAKRVMAMMATTATMVTTATTATRGRRQR
jgi:hypothetical protein